MKKLNLYIGRQVVVGFLLVTFTLMSIIWLTQSLRFVELITNKGISMGIFVKMTSLLMPRIFVVLAPISLFAAVLFVYNRMLSDRELVVMKAAGITPWQCAKPSFAFGVFMAAFCFYVYNWGIPMAEREFDEVEWQVKNDVSHLMFKAGEFTTLQNNLTIFIAAHESDGSISGILVNDERNPKIKTTLSAELGRVVYTDEGPKIIMVNGIRQEINRQNMQFSSLAFERYSVDFGMSGSSKKKAAGVRQQTLRELLGALDNPNLSEKDKKKYFYAEAESRREILESLLDLFKVKAYNAPELIDKTLNDDVRVMAAMQHYTVPTNLLDWTTSVFTAIYFALMVEINEQKSKNEEDAVIYLLNPIRMNVVRNRIYKSNP